MSPRARRRWPAAGFTLIEMLIVVAMIAILLAVAVPSYREYIKRSSRQAAQAELTELAGTQEKILLNSNAFSPSITAAYDGTATGGLGVPGGTTRDKRYTFGIEVSGAAYLLTATPVAGSAQAGDGVLTLSSEGRRRWGDKTW